MLQHLAPLFEAALPDPLDAPVRLLLVLACGTFAVHSLLMLVAITRGSWLVRVALMAATPLCVTAAVAGLAGHTVGGLVATLAALAALAVAYLRIWGAGAWASQKLAEEWDARRRAFERTAGHLAHIYAPALDAPGDPDPYHRPTDHHAAEAAALASMAASPAKGAAPLNPHLGD